MFNSSITLFIEISESNFLFLVGEQESENSFKTLYEINAPSEGIEGKNIANYDKVINLYNDLVNRNILNFNAVIIEFISISFINTNNFTKGCGLARVLNDYNYKLSQSLLEACNINQN